MKTNSKKTENNKLDFCLSSCRNYDVFIKKNKIEFYVGQIQFNEENEYWKIIFSITKIDRDLINYHFNIKNGDSGFFSTAKITENDSSIKIKVVIELLTFFKNADIAKLERNYNF
jgi:hypothetical protein